MEIRTNKRIWITQYVFGKKFQILLIVSLGLMNRSTALRRLIEKVIVKLRDFFEAGVFKNTNPEEFSREKN